MAAVNPSPSSPPLKEHHISPLQVQAPVSENNAQRPLTAPQATPPPPTNDQSITQIQRALGTYYPVINAFQCLADSIEKLQVDSDPAEIREIYDLTIMQFEKIRFLDTPKAWVLKADLLDMIDSLKKHFPAHNYASPGVKIDPIQQKQPWEEATVPIIPYNKIDEINRLGIDALRTRNFHGVQKVLGNSVVGEHTSTAKYVRILSKPTRFARFLNFIYEVLTSIAGKKYNKEATALEIATAAKQLGISSIEAVYNKSAGEEGEMRLHGPKFLFGKSVWGFQSINEFFIRDLSPEARSKYLAKTREETAQLTRDYYQNVDTDVSPIAISNSDAQIRVTRLEKGEEILKTRTITGKVLSNEAVAEAEKKPGEDPAYYTEKYKFSMKNLVGRTQQDSLQRRDVSNSNILREKGNIEDLTSRLRPRTMNPFVRRLAMDTLRNEVLGNQEVQKEIQDAQHELLGGAVRDYFQEQGAVEVIQRLATFNVHNYTTSVNGTPMSHKETAEWLRQIQEQTIIDKADAGNLSLQELQDLEKKIAHFEKIKEIFEAQETILDRPSQPTIDIYGTNQSVSTPAVRNQPGILSQNDRKVMFFRHNDGNVSMHVFIGATGVNRVDVDPRITDKLQLQGARVGDMGFGSDVYAEEGKFKAAGKKTTRDALPKLRMGEHLGEFPINGSTVISYYIPTDFVPKESLTRFQDRAQYETQSGKQIIQEDIEIKAQMGDALGIKTEIALTQFLEKYADVKPMKGSDLNAVLDSLPTEGVFTGRIQDMGEHEKAHALDLYRLLIKLKTPKTLTHTEKHLRTRLQAICEKKDMPQTPVWEKRENFAQVLHRTKEALIDMVGPNVDAACSSQPQPEQGQQSTVAALLQKTKESNMLINVEGIEDAPMAQFGEEHGRRVLSNIAHFLHPDVFDFTPQIVAIFEKTGLVVVPMNPEYKIDTTKDPVQLTITRELRICRPFDDEVTGSSLVLGTKELKTAISIPLAVLRDYDWSQAGNDPALLDAIQVVNSSTPFVPYKPQEAIPGGSQAAPA